MEQGGSLVAVSTFVQAVKFCHSSINTFRFWMVVPDIPNRFSNSASAIPQSGLQSFGVLFRPDLNGAFCRGHGAVSCLKKRRCPVSSWRRSSVTSGYEVRRKPARVGSEVIHTYPPRPRPPHLGSHPPANRFVRRFLSPTSKVSPQWNSPCQ